MPRMGFQKYKLEIFFVAKTDEEAEEIKKAVELVIRLNETNGTEVTIDYDSGPR